MRITPLTISDVPILRGIARDTFTETFSEANKAEDMDRYLAERFSEDQLARELSNPNSFFYVAEVNGARRGLPQAQYCTRTNRTAGGERARN